MTTTDTCTCLIEEDTPESNGAWDMRGCPIHDDGCGPDCDLPWQIHPECHD